MYLWPVACFLDQRVRLSIIYQRIGKIYIHKPYRSINHTYYKLFNEFYSNFIAATGVFIEEIEQCQ